MPAEVSRQAINAIETGKYDPSLPLAFRIARLFGETIEEIFQPVEGERMADRLVSAGGRAVRQPGADRVGRAIPNVVSVQR
ncbi:MAG: helix-turn-helix transcriptional regulator [Gemmatimonadales bacterium]|nr:helix-turn-helix transcriptional regulator [Gemmatimonadales bacterium]